MRGCGQVPDAEVGGGDVVAVAAGVVAGPVGALGGPRIGGPGGDLERFLSDLGK
jgi:hypothetical protein